MRVSAPASRPVPRKAALSRSHYTSAHSIVRTFPNPDAPVSVGVRRIQGLTMHGALLRLSRACWLPPPRQLLDQPLSVPGRVHLRVVVEVDVYIEPGA